MQLALPQLQAHLQKGLRSLYALHGDEALLVQEAADAIRATARLQGYTERSVHVVSGAHFDWSEVLAAGGSMSLFAERPLASFATLGLARFKCLRCKDLRAFDKLPHKSAKIAP